MAKQYILDEIGKKSKDIMRSNEELAARLRKNQDIISRFSDELEDLKASAGEKGFEPAARKELEKLKSDLEEKRQLVGTLIDDLKPIEADLARREDVIDALKQRIDDQSSKIESLSKDLVENKKQLQLFTEANNALKEQVAEKDGMVKVLKDKLAEKIPLLKEADEKNKNIEQEAMSSKKQIFMLNNKIGALEKRVFSTDEQNQKILYELMKQKEMLKEVETDLANKDLLLENQKSEYTRGLGALRKEEGEKKTLIMENHSKKIAAMNAAIALLKTKIGQQNMLIGEKAKKERALISDFNSRMRELMLTRLESIDISSIGASTESAGQEEEPAAEAGGTAGFAEGFPGEGPAEESFAGGTETAGPPKIDEVIPMIELAMDHGDDIEQIRHSLLSSGYSKKDIEEAFSRLNIVEQKP